MSFMDTVTLMIVDMVGVLDAKSRQKITVKEYETLHLQPSITRDKEKAGCVCTGCV